jgi:hypothetical protein
MPWRSKNQQQTVALQLKTSCRAVARKGEERRGEALELEAGFQIKLYRELPEYVG